MRPRRLAMLSRPFVEVAGSKSFVFRAAASLRSGVSYEWLAVDSVLPSLHGEIRLRRFGPLAVLSINARLRTSADVTGRLLSESVGPAMCSRSLRYLVRAVKAIIATPPQSLPLKNVS